MTYPWQAEEVIDKTTLSIGGENGMFYLCSPSGSTWVCRGHKIDRPDLHESKRIEAAGMANALNERAALIEALRGMLVALAAEKAGDIASTEWMNAAEAQARTVLAKAGVA